MCDVSQVDDIGEGGRIAAEVIDELANARLDVHATLVSVTTTLSRHREGTWVAVLMGKDPRRALVVAADESEPALAQYIDQYVAQVEPPDQVPTTGPTKQVIESGLPVLKPSLPLDELLALLSPAERAYVSANPLPLPVESIGLLIVPMRARGAVVGTIGLLVRGGRKPPTEEDAVWLQAAADRAGVAVESAQLHGDAIRRLDRLTSLQSVSRAVAASSDLRFTLKVILDQVTSKLGVDAADFLLLDETDGTLVVQASTGFQATSMPEYRLLLEEGLPGRALTNRRTEVFNAMDDLAHARRRSMFAREGFKAYGAVPLFAGADVVGVLEIFDRSALNPDDESRSFLEAIGGIAAIAIESAILKDRLKGPNQARRPSVAGQAPQLSGVQSRIIGMVVEGLTNRQIAEQVHLSQNTIKFHVRRLLEKTKTSNRTELARKATQEGWL